MKKLLWGLALCAAGLMLLWMVVDTGIIQLHAMIFYGLYFLFLFLLERDRTMILLASVALVSGNMLVSCIVSFALLRTKEIRCLKKGQRIIVFLEGLLFSILHSLTVRDDLYILSSIGFGMQRQILELMPYIVLLLLLGEIYYFVKTEQAQDNIKHHQIMAQASKMKLEQSAAYDEMTMKVTHRIRKHLSHLKDVNEEQAKAYLESSLNDLGKMKIDALNPYVQAVISYEREAYPDISFHVQSSMDVKGDIDSYDLAMIILYMLDVRIGMIRTEHLEPEISLVIKENEDDTIIVARSQTGKNNDFLAENIIKNIVKKHQGFVTYERESRIISTVVLNHVS